MHQGRTILFVSHNMAAVDALCTSGVLMQHGTIAAIGGVKEIIKQYVSFNSGHYDISLKDRKDRIGNGALRFTNIKLSGFEGLEKNTFMQGEELKLELSYQILNRDFNFSGIHFSLNLFDDIGNLIFHHTNRMIGKTFDNDSITGHNTLTFVWHGIPLRSGNYHFNIDAVHYNQFLDFVENAPDLNIIDGTIYNYLQPPANGMIAIDADWEIA